MLSSQSDWPCWRSSLIAVDFAFAGMSARRRELGRRGHDLLHADARGVHELLGLAGAGEALDREVRDLQAVLARERLEHGGREAALGVVVLDDHEAALGDARRL